MPALANYAILRSIKRGSVTVFWVILSIDKITIKLKETWK